jgi:hypothetical protein
MSIALLATGTVTVLLGAALPIATAVRGRGGLSLASAVDDRPLEPVPDPNEPPWACLTCPYSDGQVRCQCV